MHGNNSGTGEKMNKKPDLFDILYTVAKEANPFNDGGVKDSVYRKLTMQPTWTEEQENIETMRYWKDYEKNTGVTPLYPYLIGKEGRPTIGERLTQDVPTGTQAMKKLYGGQI